MSKIEWTDETWNPTTGCDKISPGCGLPRFDGDDTGGCYALALAKRLKAMGSAKYQNDGDPRTSGPGFGLTVHPDALTVPLRPRRPPPGHLGGCTPPGGPHPAGRPRPRRHRPADRRGGDHLTGLPADDDRFLAALAEAMQGPAGYRPPIILQRPEFPRAAVDLPGVTYSLRGDGLIEATRYHATGTVSGTALEPADVRRVAAALAAMADEAETERREVTP